MTTPIAPLSLSQIQTEFGGANPISISEYYRGGGTGYVPAGQATSTTDGVAVSTSGTIRMGMFRNLTKAVTINLTIAANTADYNVFTAAGSPGAAVTVNLTINSGIYVFASSTGVWALNLGSGWHASTVINIYNNGVVAGRGGAGGAGGTAGTGFPGGAGGPAFNATRAVVVYNYGTFGGGGGGGGGAGGYFNGKSYFQNGGGGGGRVNGAGGAINGSAGTLTAAGAGGTVYSAGGAGGNLGTAGATGSTYSFGGGPGGATGTYVTNNGVVTWAATGSRLGSVG